MIFVAGFPSLTRGVDLSPGWGFFRSSTVVETSFSYPASREQRHKKYADKIGLNRSSKKP